MVSADEKIGIRMEEIRPIFIVGMPRSGTTLLQLIINAHSDVAIAPETHFFRKFWQRRNAYGDLSDNGNFSKLVEDLTACEFLKNLNIPDFSTKILTLEREQFFFIRFFDFLIRSYAEKRNKTIFGEKTPIHFEYLHEIWNLYPQARIVIANRNAFDVIASLKTVPWGTTDISESAGRWNRYTDRSLKLEKKCPDRIHMVYYEKMVLEPEETVRQLCRFLSIDFQAGMLQFYEDRSVPIYNKDEFWHKNCFEPIRSDTIGRGYNQLSRFEILRISRLCRTNLKRLGYSVRRRSVIKE